MSELNFDATSVDPATPFEVLPNGQYRVVISNTEMKPTKAGDGTYLEVEYTVTEGEHESRRLWSRHNVQHPNAKAEQIARQELSAICHAVGVLKVTDSAELHDKPLTIEVGIEQRRDTGEDVNRVRAWIGAAKPAAKPLGIAKPVNATPAKPTPPWQKTKAATA